MSVCKYAYFFINLSQNLDLTLQNINTSLSHCSEFYRFKWIEDCLQ